MNTTYAALLLCLSLTMTYVAARTGRFSLPYVTLIGIAFNALTFFQFILVQEPYPARAIAVGLQLSLIFTVLSVGIACVFRLLAKMELSQPQPVIVSDLVEMFFNS